MKKAINRATGVLFSIVLSGCVATDQFSSRIYSSNVNSQAALDQETLLNIARASRYQPLTFVAITKVAGQQTGDLKVGLPTFTFGPLQTAAQRQYSFANNAIDTSAQGSFESNPLISSVFQQGMMTPVTARIVALLLSSFPREQVFFAVLDGIKVRSEKEAYFFSNDPYNNYLDGEKMNRSCIDIEAVTLGGVEHGLARKRLNIDYNRDCNFSQFSYLLEYAIASGFSAELDNTRSSSPTKLADGDAAKITNAVTSPAPPGYFCFDPTLARPDLRAATLTASNMCSSTGPAKQKNLKLQFGNKWYDIELKFRSPLGIYAYLGSLVRLNSVEQVRLQDQSTGSLIPANLVSIDENTVQCLLETGAVGGVVCNTDIAARNTLIMVGILEQLRNIMISPSDLNSSFSVRLAF